MRAGIEYDHGVVRGTGEEHVERRRHGHAQRLCVDRTADRLHQVDLRYRCVCVCVVQVKRDHRQRRQGDGGQRFAELCDLGGDLEADDQRRCARDQRADHNGFNGTVCCEGNDAWREEGAICRRDNAYLAFARGQVLPTHRRRRRHVHRDLVLPADEQRCALNLGAQRKQREEGDGGERQRRAHNVIRYCLGLEPDADGYLMHARQLQLRQVGNVHREHLRGAAETIAPRHRRRLEHNLHLARAANIVARDQHHVADTRARLGAQVDVLSVLDAHELCARDQSRGGQGQAVAPQRREGIIEDLCLSVLRGCGSGHNDAELDWTYRRRHRRQTEHEHERSDVRRGNVVVRRGDTED
eukprot:PhM_4_TR14699/c0_g2_i2/m.68386